MWRIETRRELDDKEFYAIGHLIDDAAEHDGFRSLSDQLWLDLVNRSQVAFAAVLAIDDLDRISAYAQLAEGNLSIAVELVVSPDVRNEITVLAPLMLRAAFDQIAAGGGGTVYWWVHRPDDTADVIASEVGLTLGRRLLQLRRTLPIDETTDVATRAFVVGGDETEWLRVNNAAFHDHPEQGGWSIDTLRQREVEPWFDPEGFRLHERDGKLAAFCWTKVHDDATPPMGEIYVIAVDPTFQGLGLGRAMTLAGLHHLASSGLTVGMLHVDGANTAALSLYERLGFTAHHADHAYVGEIPARL
ncbi:MAG TPA: mycothiol synthase [Ilumatobacteraceae bacterium]|nr:mycothiol synthase [Ilumatobacteraceae bacterium]